MKQRTQSPRGLLLGGTLLFVAFAALTVVDGLPAARDNVNMVLSRALLGAATAALAVVVAFLCLVRWRLSEDAGGLWAGVALFGFGTVTVAVTGLLPLVYRGTDTATLAWASAASRVVVMGLLAAAVWSHRFDGRVRLGHLAAVGTAATIALTFAFRLAPDVAKHLTGSADVHPTLPVSSFEGLFVVLAWTVLAAGFLVKGARRDRPLLSWLGVLLAGLALAEAVRLLASEGTALFSIGAQLLQLTALAIGLVGTTLELVRSYGHLAHDLMESRVSTAAAEARLRAGRRESEERAHEASNALQSIEGAAKTLERHHDQLDPQARQSLAQAVSAEIARLQRLVSIERSDEELAPFGVGETLAPVITGERSLGAGVLVDIEDGLQAHGRWSDTAQVVQNLIENARRYAPGSPVAVRARRDRDRVVIRVEDRGPGVAPEQREAIFRRGVRGEQSRGVPGRGLGLYVSARLMKDQNGELTLEDRPGGGAVFVAALPALEDSARSGGGNALDEGDEVIEGAQGDTLAPDEGHADGGGLR